MHKKHVKVVTVEHYGYTGIMLDPALLLKLLEHATVYTDDAWLHLIVERAHQLCHERGSDEPLGMADYPLLIAPVEGMSTTTEPVIVITDESAPTA